MKLKIVSYNNFPTAAGLASSSSGIACLGIIIYFFINVTLKAICLQEVYCFQEEYPH